MVSIKQNDKKEDSNWVVVTGCIANGRKVAANHIEKAAPELESLLGKRMFNGSLNAVLSGPIRLVEQNAIVFDDGRRLVWPVLVNDQAVWLYRWRNAPLHIVEFLSDECLREKLKLENSQDISIKISSKDVQPLLWQKAFLWCLVWCWRRHLFYSNSFYYRLGQRMSKWLGIVQSKKPGRFRKIGKRLFQRLR